MLTVFRFQRRKTNSSIAGNRVAQEAQPYKERGRNYGIKGSQVPQHLFSKIPDSYLLSFSAYIECGQIILKSKYRRNAGHSLPTSLLKRP